MRKVSEMSAFKHLVITTIITTTTITIVGAG